MNSLQLFFIAAGLSLISWASSAGIVSREYLPTVDTTQRFFHVPSSYYKPDYNHKPQYYPTYPYYPSYPTYQSNYHQYPNGGVGGYQQQGLGTSVGIAGVGGYYPNINLALLGGTKPKPRVDVIDTVYDTNGGYVYGKKK